MFFSSRVQSIPAVQLDYDLAVSMIIHFLELANVPWTETHVSIVAMD